MRKITVPEYPLDFFSFEGGSEISDNEINKWIMEAINLLEQNLDSNSYGTSSGNTSVTVTRYHESDIEGEYTYDINVSKNYSSASIDITGRKNLS